MIGKHDPGSDAEGCAGMHPTNRVAQYVDLRHQIRTAVATDLSIGVPGIEIGPKKGLESGIGSAVALCKSAPQDFGDKLRW
jgi:hypothetical protein